LTGLTDGDLNSFRRRFITHRQVEQLPPRHIGPIVTTPLCLMGSSSSAAAPAPPTATPTATILGQHPPPRAHHSRPAAV